MSKGDLNFKGTPWLGGLCRKIEKMCHEVDQMMSQDTVRYAKGQIETVGENVRKLGSNVMNDLAFPAFLASKANSASSSGINPVRKPKINSKVIDIECPADAITDKLAVRELKNSCPEEFSSTSADLVSSLKDDHWSNESVERIVVDDLEVGKLFPSEAPELTCSDEDDPSEQCPESCSTNMVQEVEDDNKEKVPSSSEGSESPHAVREDTVESLSKSASINKAEEDTTFPSTTDGPLYGLSQHVEPVTDPMQECDSDIASEVFCSEQGFCQNESTGHGVIPLSSSLLSESLDLVEIPLPDLPKKEGRTSGQSNASISATKGLLMETIDLSDEVKLDRSCFMVEKDMNLSFSSRKGCFNRYKEKIQNPFGSKKRLEKDYKLLAIWHGDIDADFRQLTQSNRILGPTAADDLKISPVQDVEDTEWEII